MSNQQMADLASAYQAFVVTIRELSPQAFLTSLGDWSPRDIVAHFIGWNRITLEGCSQLQQNQVPHYFYDGTNDYRIVNAEFISRYDSTEREALLFEMASTMQTLMTYLDGVAEQDWERDAGVVHYRGGPATVARCVDSLIRDYRKHRDEIIHGQEQ
jgi:hypothetical protein